LAFFKVTATAVDEDVLLALELLPPELQPATDNASIAGSPTLANDVQKRFKSFTENIQNLLFLIR